MRIPIVMRLVTVISCCLLIPQISRAQNTTGYATVDYDEETNIVYGYAHTEPTYSASIYYNQTYVGATIYDANNNVVASVPNHTAFGRAEISFQGPGTGHPPYRIQSGHYVFASYYVSNYWDPWTSQYRNGYLDYYFYSYYSPGGAGFPTLADLFFNFLGRNPYTVTPSLNMLLGQLLNSIFPINEEVIFNTAQVHDKTVNFQKIIQYNATINMLGSSHAQQVCVDNQWFNLRVDFTLQPNTSLSSNRCTARPIGGPDSDYQVSTVTCVIDDSFNRKGHLNASVRRKCCPAANEFPKISIGIGCNRSGSGVCDTKAVVKILC